MRLANFVVRLGSRSWGVVAPQLLRKSFMAQVEPFLHLGRAVLVVAVAAATTTKDAAGQDDGDHPRFRTAIELGFLRLDNGPFGAPPALNLGVGLRGSLKPDKFDGHAAIELQASYLLALGNWVPHVAALEAMLVAEIPPFPPKGSTPNPFVSVGIGGANFMSGGTTLEAYCNVGLTECVGRNRFRTGWRGWVTAGTGLEMELGSWLPERVHVQLVLPVPSFAEERQRWYLRVGLAWRIGGG